MDVFEPGGEYGGGGEPALDSVLDQKVGLDPGPE